MPVPDEVPGAWVCVPNPDGRRCQADWVPCDACDGQEGPDERCGQCQGSGGGYICATHDRNECEEQGTTMQLNTLEVGIQACRKCESILCKYGVEPRPIFSGGIGYPIFLLGQAPGKTEYDKRAPFQGDAGKSIKAQFAAAGLKSFEGTVYQTSVTKCFPGRLPGKSTDRKPNTTEVKNCLPFLEEQLRLVQPKLLVCLGGLSWTAFLSLKERADPGFCSREVGIARPSVPTVPDMVGRRFHWGSTIVLPMIHPAGSANGARAKYPDQDRASKDLLAQSIAELGLSQI